MGYSLYITRRPDRTATESSISLDEWRRHVAADAELRFDESLGEHVAVWSGASKHEIPWLAWSDGEIESKYPDEALIRKMWTIAEALEAKVQGEEGETYDARGVAHAAPAPGWFRRLKTFLANAVSAGASPIDPADLPFDVGERVRSIVGSWRGTILKIDVRAEHGLGRITVRRDDGTLIHQAAIAHGLVPDGER